jgi:Domain of unknown function (DUF4136)
VRVSACAITDAVRPLPWTAAEKDVPVMHVKELIMRIPTVLTTALVAWLGATVLASTVTYDYDRTANFSKFRSYTWVRGNPAKDDLNHQRIMGAVDAQLAMRGFSKVENGGTADVLVAYHATFDESIQVNMFGSGGWGPYGFGGSRMGNARADRITVASLVVDMVDASAKKIVWRGTASQDLDPNANAEKKDKNISKAVEKMFKNYPPTH